MSFFISSAETNVSPTSSFYYPLSSSPPRCPPPYVLQQSVHPHSSHNYTHPGLQSTVSGGIPLQQVNATPRGMPTYAPQSEPEIDWDALPIDDLLDLDDLAAAAAAAAEAIPDTYGQGQQQKQEHSSAETIASSRKHKRESASDEDESCIKAMRHGSLDRIIASTTVASAAPALPPPFSAETAPQQSEEERAEARKAVATRMMRLVRLSNMNALAKLIQENFHERATWTTPDLLQTLADRGEIMMLFSLIFEVFPDGVWTVQSIALSSVDSHTVTCVFRFTGTRLFPFSMDVLFNQIRAHMARQQLSTAFGNFSLDARTQQPRDVSLMSQRLVNEVTEGCLVVPLSDHSESAVRLPLRSMLSSSRQGSQGSENSVWNALDEDDNDDSIRVPRRTQSLREVKVLENSVLKEGPTSYKRRLDIVFDDYGKIIRLIATNIT